MHLGKLQERVNKISQYEDRLVARHLQKGYETYTATDLFLFSGLDLPPETPSMQASKIPGMCSRRLTALTGICLAGVK